MKDSRLDGRVALVTGASRGVGRGIARRFARAGARVVLSARSVAKGIDFEGSLEESAELIRRDGGEAFIVAGDLEEASERDTLVERSLAAAGRLDILVNNAGLALYEPVATMSDEVFTRTFDQYLRAPFKLCQAAIPLFREQGEGWIVNVGSVTAQRPLRPFDDWARFGGATLYGSVKAAVARFTQGLAAELEQDGIAVNLVAPSTAISTPGADRYVPKDYPTEPVEYLAEVALELAYLPAAKRTGLLAHSLHFFREAKLSAVDFERGEALPVPEIPDYAHPEILSAGE